MKDLWAGGGIFDCLVRFGGRSLFSFRKKAVSVRFLGAVRSRSPGEFSRTCSCVSGIMEEEVAIPGGGRGRGTIIFWK